MSQVILITIEGVLAGGPDLKKALPLKWAKPLYESLRSQYRTVALTRSDTVLGRWWLNRQGLNDWSGVLAWNSVLSYENWIVDQVRDFLANGWEVAFLVTSDPEIAKQANDLGVATLTFGTPTHHPGWKSEDTNFVPWEDLEARL